MLRERGDGNMKPDTEEKGRKGGSQPGGVKLKKSSDREVGRERNRDRGGERWRKGT